MSISAMNYSMTLEEAYKLLLENQPRWKTLKNNYSAYGSSMPTKFGDTPNLLMEESRSKHAESWGTMVLSGNIESMKKDFNRVFVKFMYEEDKIRPIREVAERMGFYVSPTVHTDDAIDLYLRDPSVSDFDACNIYAHVTTSEASIELERSPIMGLRLLDKYFAESKKRL